MALTSKYGDALGVVFRTQASARAGIKPKTNRAQKVANKRTRRIARKAARLAAAAAYANKYHPVTITVYKNNVVAHPKAKSVFPEIPTYRSGMSAGEFYQTREWLELRFKTIERYGSQCQCCGATKSKTVWMHIDHIKPRSFYPLLELDPENLQVLCRECNIGKSNKSVKDWR